MNLFKYSFLSLLGIFVSLQTSNAQNPGIRLDHIDSSANPREDFYTFCNGKWEKTFQLPESDARYGSFNEINENNLKKIKQILDAASANKTAVANTNAQKLRDFYNTAVDSLKAESLGAGPIKAQLARIDQVKTIDEFMKLKAEMEFDGINLLFGSYVSPDLKNSKRNSFTIVQTGLGLPDRDYYFSDNYAGIREAYRQYITNLYTLAGFQPHEADKASSQTFDLEKKLADSSFTRVRMRDIEKMYNVYNAQDLAQLTPSVKWPDYFRTKKIKQPDTVIVGMVNYMKQVDLLLTNTPIEALKTYARTHLIMESAPYLSRKIVEASFQFRGVVLSGAKQMKPMWQRAHNTMNNTIGEIVSQEFVKKHFTPEAKAKVNTLIDNLILAYRERINSRDWMTEETKKQAQRKLDLLIRKVGYPDKWKDYSSLVVMTDNYWANVCRANRFLVEDNLSDLKKPVDRNKWQMTPVTVNAYYDPTTNEITFPAAILQPPFFDPAAEDAANYGTMGSIIGHELTHGFDDQGSQFDADGNMKMWWTEQDYKNFKNRTTLIINQFNNYVAIDTLKVNGNMTQGENIADLGGLTMAYYAYKKSLKGQPSKIIGGFTGEQRFFIAWTQGWKSKTRDAELKRLLATDYHAPAYFRAFAPLSNMKEFYQAFGVKPGDKMYNPDDKRVEIW